MDDFTMVVWCGTIEVRYNKISIIISSLFFGGIPFLSLITLIIRSIRDGEFAMPVYMFIYLIIFLIISFVVMFSFGPNFSFVFGEDGITKTIKVRFLSITIIDKKTFFPWGEVIELDYDWGIPGGFMFYHKNHFNFAAMLNFTLNNKKEALEFTVTKMTADKITTQARKKLKKKYGIVVK